MIGFFDALTLARTKLRTKKVLLIVTVVLASLVFGVIIAGATVITGATNSAQTYLKSSLDNRYLVELNPVIPDAVNGFISTDTAPSSSLKTTLLTLQDQYISQQKALAKQYNVTFDSTSILPIFKPSPFGTKDSVGQVQQVIDTTSPVWQLYVNQLQAAWLKTANNTLSDLKVAAGKYGANNYYQNSYGTISYSNAQYLASGSEDITKYGQQPSTYDASTSVRNSAYIFTDQSLINRFILPENSKRQQNTSAIPVVVTAQESIDLFGKQLSIGKQPTSAADQITWMKDLQNKINGQTYQVCYRSTGQTALIQQTMQQTVAAETQTKDNPYTPPALTYNLPTSNCGDLTVKKDNRTTAQINTDANTEKYEKANGTYKPVTSQLLTFQVVGVMSIANTTPGSNSYASVSAFVNALLGVNYYNGAFIPNQMYSQLSSDNQHKDILQDFNGSYAGFNDKAFLDAGVGDKIVAFPSVQQAQDFINNDTCYTQDSSGCNRPWTSQIYGSNYLLINDFTKLIGSVVRIALPIALAIAAVIIWITMARVIIDSRHETAVFRALGAKRIDIVRIYVGYSFIVSLIVALFALILGGVGAVVVEALYGAQTTNYAKVAYGTFDQLQPFSFIGINIYLIVLVIAAIIVISLIATLPPLIRNVRRNPIRDMRDDN
jgi:hypothetical protein